MRLSGVRLKTEYRATNCREQQGEKRSINRQNTVWQNDSMETITDCPSPAVEKYVSDPLAMGRLTVPLAIEELGSKGVDIVTVAILRFIWRYGKSKWVRVHQPELAKQLNISVRTAQRHLKEAKRLGLIEFQQSSTKPKDGGYFCEYRINWRRVFAYHELTFQAGSDFNIEDLQWINAYKAKNLPHRFFSEAVLRDRVLHVVTRDNRHHVLPRDGYEVLRYVAETHYGRAISEDSLDTLMNTAGRITPRLLSLFSFALASNKTVPDSPGYYTRILQKNRLQAFGPPKTNKRKDLSRAIPIIKIKLAE
jgi:hypothetical protein